MSKIYILQKEISTRVKIRFYNLYFIRRNFHKSQDTFLQLLRCTGRNFYKSQDTQFLQFIFYRKKFLQKLRYTVSTNYILEEDISAKGTFLQLLYFGKKFLQKLRYVSTIYTLQEQISTIVKISFYN